MSTKALAMKRSTLFAVAVLGTFLASQTPFAAAVPISKRVSFSQRGDFVIIGNNGAFDCGQYGSGSAKKDNQLSPTVGTVDRSSCGSNISDSGGDVLWRAESTTASATTSVTTSTARTTAVLELPAGATVSYARVYWGGTIPESQTTHDPDLTIEYLGTGGARSTRRPMTERLFRRRAMATPFISPQRL